MVFACGTPQQKKWIAKPAADAPVEGGEALAGEEEPPADEAIPEEPPPLKHYTEVRPPKIALVLGGGGARGFAHIGVLRILEREKIPINLIVGTSVGSLIGALYAAEPNTFELEWKAFQLEEDDFFDISLFSAPTGPVKGEAIRDFVRKNVKKSRIEDFPIPYIAIAADLNTGERVDFKRGLVVDAVRASVSIPGVFTPAKVGNRTLIDGGVVANLAVNVARENGADVVIASNITEGVVDYKVSNVISIILQSINIMMGQMAAYETQNADVVITPRIGDVGTMDFSQKKRCMAAGIDSTEDSLLAIKRAIGAYYKSQGAQPPPGFDFTDPHS